MHGRRSLLAGGREGGYLRASLYWNTGTRKTFGLDKNIYIYHFESQSQFQFQSHKFQALSAPWPQLFICVGRYKIRARRQTLGDSDRDGCTW